MVAELNDTAVEFDPRWRTDDVMGLARGIHQAKAFERMPILGDPLMDAGCDDERIIAHCRAGSYPQGSWLITLILVNELWKQVYQALDMEEEYQEEIQNFSLDTSSTYWPILVLNGVTPNKVITTFKKLGVDVYSYYDDIDRQITENDRDPKNGSYVVICLATVEADEENKNQSANQRRKNNCQDITLLERLLLELFYFLATGHHLDIQNVTLCTGSRYSDGRVPFVYWHSDNRKLYVYWNNPDFRYDNLRARTVVSCQRSQAKRRRS